MKTLSCFLIILTVTKASPLNDKKFSDVPAEEAVEMFINDTYKGRDAQSNVDTVFLERQSAPENTNSSNVSSASSFTNNSSSSNPTMSPVTEVDTEIKPSKDDILISYPSNFGGNFQIALDDPSSGQSGTNFHPLWFLRPVVKKIEDAVGFLNHPNTALTPAHVIKKLRDKALLVLKKTYRDICGPNASNGY